MMHCQSHNLDYSVANAGMYLKFDFYIMDIHFGGVVDAGYAAIRIDTKPLKSTGSRWVVFSFL
jgi:hypothetical protein